MATRARKPEHAAPGMQASEAAHGCVFAGAWAAPPSPVPLVRDELEGSRAHDERSRHELTTGLEIGRVAPDAIPEVSYCYVAKPGAGGSTAAAVIFVAKREGLNAPVFTTWEWDARLLGLTAAQLETMAREGCLFADSPADLKEKSAARDASRPAPRSREERHA